MFSILSYLIDKNRVFICGKCGKKNIFIKLNWRTDPQNSVQSYSNYIE